MARKTLIINGSPRVNGNTAALISELRRHLQGEVIEISAFRSNIAPCVDCRGCWDTAVCVVRDEMQVIYDDDFDNVVIASPVYYGTLPGQVLSLMSRLQPWHAAAFFLKQPLRLRPKKSAAILTAGGKGNQANARHHMSALFRMLGATGFEEHTVCSPRTDTHPAAEDAEAMAGVAELARWLMEDEKLTADNIPVIAFSAYSGTGKTTLIEKLVVKLKEHGLRLAVIKHDAHNFEIDHEGKDSWRFAKAGADIWMC